MADKVKTGKGKTKWCGNSVYRILRNEKYCGDILMQKRVTLDFLTHKRAPNRGHQPQYFIADHHPAIIPKETWQSVQLELDRRYKMNTNNENGRAQKHSNRTAFSNLLYCGSCGEPLVRRTFTSYRKNEKYYYGAWRCRVADGRKKDVECQARSYREEAMEHTFITVTLPTNLQRCCRGDRHHMVDLILTPVFPSERLWQQFTVTIKSGDHFYINLEISHFYHTFPKHS